MRIEVDKALCAGLGICEAEAPDYFMVDDHDVSTPIHAVVAAADLGKVIGAVESCPMQALRLERRAPEDGNA